MRLRQARLETETRGRVKDNVARRDKGADRARVGLGDSRLRSRPALAPARALLARLCCPAEPAGRLGENRVGHWSLPLPVSMLSSQRLANLETASAYPAPIAVGPAHNPAPMAPATTKHPVTLKTVSSDTPTAAEVRSAAIGTAARQSPNRSGASRAKPTPQQSIETIADIPRYAIAIASRPVSG